MGGDSDGGEPTRVQAVDDELVDEAESWPGLESLPPSPPFEYPPARPFRRRPAPSEASAELPAPRPVAVLVPADRSADEPAVPPGRRRRRTLTALAAAVVVLLLVPALILAGRSRGGDEDAATTTTTGVPGTSTTNPADPTTTTTAAPPAVAAPPTLPSIVVAPDPPLEAAIVEVSAFVAEHRGLAYGEPPQGVRLADDEFEARVREQILADPIAVEAEGNMLKLLGLLDPETDYLTEYLATYPALVGAYFDPETALVVLRGEPGAPVPPGLLITLAHELTHALDFHAFDLYERVYPDPGTEQQFGFEALVEGDAERIEHEYAASTGVDPSHVTADSYDDVVSTRMAATYQLGEILVDDIVARGGQPELDADFDDPPSTSEQVLHPEKYAAREPVVTLAEPKADGALFWTGVTGEYNTGQMLRSAVDASVGDAAAAGWGNDRGVIWVQSPSEDGLTCLRIAYAMDTADDLAELEAAFATWAAAAPDRSSFRRADTLVVTVCAPVPPPPPDGTSTS